MNALPQTVVSLPVSFDAYLRLGWKLVAIPRGTKGPRLAGWNREDHAIHDSTQIPPGYGVGIAHAFSGTCAIDIDHWTATKGLLAERGVDLDALYNALDAVTIESGRKGHGKLLYRMPFGLTLPSKKLTYTAPDGSKQVAYELRCATTNGCTVQDVLPPSTHPQTNLPYQWGGRGKWTDLPVIPVSLLDIWQTLCSQPAERVISTDTIPTSWDDIRSALAMVPADCQRDQWLTIGMALHHAGSQVNQLDDALAIWHEWSASAPTKYKGPSDIDHVWRSFKADSGIKIGSLFHIAQEYGYKRPSPDVTSLFHNVVPDEPIKVLHGMHLPPPDMDMSLWPDLIRIRALEVSESVGCDPLVPLFSGIATICAAVDAQTRLELVEGYQVPPVLWVMTIGDPADKKTPGARPMMQVLSQIEREDRPRFKQSMVQWEALDNMYQQSKKHYIEAAATDTESILTGVLNHSTLPQVGAEPPPQPVEVKLVVEDITSQKLVRIVADRPRGVMCHLDEMKSWIEKLGDVRSGEDRSCWVKSYEADPYSMDRVSEKGTIKADNMAVSIYGNIQPKVYKERITQMSDDGLLQRFIPAILREDFTKRGEPIPDMFSHRSEWDMKVREIYALPVTTYRLDPSAYQLFREFQLWYEQTKRDERLLHAVPVFMQAFGKLEGTAGRIILIMHLMENPYRSTVNADTVSRAIEIVQTYVVPAYRYALGETAGMIDNSLESYLTEKIVQLSGEQETITLSDLRRLVERRVTDAPRYVVNQQICDAMETLETAKWVTIINDHKDRKTWAINAELAKQNTAHRLGIIKAKQRRQDASTALVRRKGFDVSRKLVKGYDPSTMD